ncbi:MAG: rhodanese-like domain-containing protein [Terriglobia bacterium]
MTFLSRSRVVAALAGLFVLGLILFADAGSRMVLAAPADAVPGRPQSKSADPSPIAAAALIRPEDLAKVLSSLPSERPVLIYVGFRMPYTQAHIPDSENLGPAATQAALEQLLKRMEGIPRDRFVVIYCGCCPWNHCPNVRPAYQALHNHGFKKLKVLYLADNLGTDWVNKGYPVAKGE